MKCLTCGDETSNPSFCSRSCAAKRTNTLQPKRRRKPRSCTVCHVDITTTTDRRQRRCPECSTNLPARSLGDVRADARYQVNAAVRDNARRVYKRSDRPKRCVVCGYDKHYDVAHIRGISDWPLTALISEVNCLSNLVALCKNHHWEFDHGRMRYSDLALVRGVEPRLEL